jgi:hypothetical protein
VKASERQLFDQLLERVARKLRENHPEVSLPIQEWKGEEIALFREDLQQKVLGSISEKWFYTHIKKQQDKLPRVDTLNLFANYIDEESWKAFSYKYTTNETSEIKATTKIPPVPITPEPPKKSLYKKYLVFGLSTLAVLFMIINWLPTTPTHYRFCFIDQNTHLPVVDSFLAVKVIKTDESPVFKPLLTNCFEGTGQEVEFVIKGRFYRPLHIKRTITKESYEETIFIEPDDYTMMLHLFANSKVKDWKKRRQQLSEMMSEELKAYEISEDGFTIAILSKKEFINKLTLPTRGLQRTEIINTIYDGEKISTIKFLER